jgi:hypothetical protein
VTRLKKASAPWPMRHSPYYWPIKISIEADARWF